MKRSDYPGSDLPRKELHKRLMSAYQLAGRLLVGNDDPEDVRVEMEIVLLDFLSDPGTADCDRIDLAARAFHTKHKAKAPAIAETTGGITPNFVVTDWTAHTSCNVAGCTICARPT